MWERDMFHPVAEAKDEILAAAEEQEWQLGFPPAGWDTIEAWPGTDLVKRVIHGPVQTIPPGCVAMYKVVGEFGETLTIQVTIKSFSLTSEGKCRLEIAFAAYELGYISVSNKDVRVQRAVVGLFRAIEGKLVAPAPV